MPYVRFILGSATVPVASAGVSPDDSEGTSGGTPLGAVGTTALPKRLLLESSRV